MDQMPPTQPSQPSYASSGQPQQFYVPPPRKMVALATTALVFAICGIIICLGPLLALTGLVLGIIALACGTTANKRAIAAVVVGAVLLVSSTALHVAILLPSLNRAKAIALQAACVSSLKQVGFGIMFYADDNQDAYPPDIDRSLVEYLGEDPSAKPGTRIACVNAQAAADRGYFYATPAGLTRAGVAKPTAAMIACDYAGNHPTQRSVLFADGHVQALDAPEFDRLLAEPQNAAFAAALREAEAGRTARQRR